MLIGRDDGESRSITCYRKRRWRGGGDGLINAIQVLTEPLVQHHPLFGTRTMVLVSKLAARSGATVVFSVAERLPDGRGFRLRFRLASDLIAASDDMVAARALNEGVEECIRWCPSQYQWSYDRFRLRQTLRNNDSPTAREQRAA